jgi:hypothetical protein
MMSVPNKPNPQSSLSANDARSSFDFHAITRFAAVDLTGSINPSRTLWM